MGDLDFAVRESAARRTVGITVDRDGSLLLHTPPDCDPDALTAWVRPKRSWVYQKLAEKDLVLSARPDKEFVTGEGFAYLGRNHRLLIVDADRVRMQRGRILLPRGLNGNASAALVGWYPERGREWLTDRLRAWATRMELTPTGSTCATSATGGDH